MNDKSIKEDTSTRITSYLNSMEKTVDSALHMLFGKIPNWLPIPTIDRAKRTIQKLITDGFSANEIQRSIMEAERNCLTFPGTVFDPTAFAQFIYELVNIKHSISLGKSIGLKVLAGDQAELGQRFKDGRKSGTVGPIRKAIANTLTKNPRIKNSEIWNVIKQNPPKAWQVYETARLGKYLEGPTAKDQMRYKRFCNVCSEERKNIKKKIPG